MPFPYRMAGQIDMNMQNQAILARYHPSPEEDFSWKWLMKIVLDVVFVPSLYRSSCKEGSTGQSEHCKLTLLEHQGSAKFVAFFGLIFNLAFEVMRLDLQAALLWQTYASDRPARAGGVALLIRLDIQSVEITSVMWPLLESPNLGVPELDTFFAGSELRAALNRVRHTAVGPDNVSYGAVSDVSREVERETQQDKSLGNTQDTDAPCSHRACIALTGIF
uniref:Uncharacterized protein n=1 Tax=Timema tahoe TaxID=61484 RepID=A0A7R9I9F4_9NEOP|nr:unnamed protein product [Timema tahoe]